MSEQAIETAAIKWTPVNPMGYLLRAYGKGAGNSKSLFSVSAFVCPTVLFMMGFLIWNPGNLKGSVDGFQGDCELG